MKITIECGNAMGSSDKEVRHILMDALYEFVSHRGPTAEAYVNKRYPIGKDYAWLDRQEKIKQVNRRIHTAVEMHASIITIEDI